LYSLLKIEGEKKKLSRGRCLEIEKIVRESFQECTTCKLFWDGFAQHDCPFPGSSKPLSLFSVLNSVDRWTSEDPFEFGGFKFGIGRPRFRDTVDIRRVLLKHFKTPISVANFIND